MRRRPGPREPVFVEVLASARMTTLLASSGATACAAALSGMSSVRPLLRRFMFLPMNASSLARYSATSICCSDTPSARFADAIFASVSPGLTTIAARAGARGSGRRAGTGEPARSRVPAPRAPTTGAGCCTGAVAACTGGAGCERRRLRPLVVGRIEQERVLAHQPAARPVQLDQQVQERARSIDCAEVTTTTGRPPRRSTENFRLAAAPRCTRGWPARNACIDAQARAQRFELRPSAGRRSRSPHAAADRARQDRELPKPRPERDCRREPQSQKDQSIYDLAFTHSATLRGL